MLHYLWQKCLIKIKNYLSEYEFNMWIFPLQVNLINKYIYLCAPNFFILNYVRKKYFYLICKYIIRYYINFNYIKFIVGNKRLIFKRIYIKNRSKKILDKYLKFNDLFLFNKCRFSNFICSKSNFFAYNKIFNLSFLKKKNNKIIFLYSYSGLGKTHLLYSLINNINTIYKFKKNIIYINCYKFIKKMYFLIKNYNFLNFKFYIKSVDLFLIEDIHLIVNNFFLQKKFLFILNYLFKYNKKYYIIITSNLNINNLNFIYDLSFLLSINIINICKIDYIIKYIFIKKYFKKNNILIKKNIINYICKIEINNFYELKEILDIIYIYSIYFKCLNNININFIKLISYNYLNLYDFNFILNIQKNVCIYYNICIKKLLSESRIKKFLYPRQISIFLSKKIINLSFYKLGLFYNNLNYSIILYSYNKIKKLYINDNLVKKDIDYLTKIILKKIQCILY